jgi:hypothetical protein
MEKVKNTKLSIALRGNKNALGNNGGRPTLFNETCIKLVYKLACLGLTDKELASCLGISERTLNYWKVENPDFEKSIIKGKLIADAEVAANIYKMAIGYSYETEKVMMYQGQILRIPYTKRVMPNVQAQIYWLRCRVSQIWNV